MSSVPTDKIIGPCGGNGGSFFSLRPIQKIYKIIISSGGEGENYPIGMTFFFRNEDDSTDKFTIGGGGSATHTVHIDGEFEYLVEISGTHAPYEDSMSDVLLSVKFTTSARVYGPYGVNVGTKFDFQVPDGNKIVGFLGRSGSYIDAIGIYYALV